MKRSVLLCFIVVYLLTAPFAVAQKAELKERCNEIQKVLKENKPFRMEYVMTVTPKENEGQAENMRVSFYKSGENYKMIMGELQEVIIKDNLTLVLNHPQKMLSVQEEKLNLADQTIIGPLLQIIDNATTCVQKLDKDLVSYILTFSDNMLYQKLELTFSRKNNALTALYAEYSRNYPEPYASVKVNYTTWDLKWIPEKNFPNVENYIVKSEGRYKAQPAWNKYHFYQPETGTLKF